MEVNDTYTPPGERRRPSVTAAALLTLLAAAGLWVASLLAALLLPAAAPSRELAMDGLYYLPFVLLPVTAYCLRRRGLSDALRLNPMPLGNVMTVALTALMSVYAASAVDSVWGMLLDALGLHAPEAAFAVETPRALVWAIVYAAAIPAVCEELLCRGVVLAAFEDRGTAFAIGVSSVLFGLLHGNIYGLPAYVAVGAISAFIVVATDSLYAGIFYHTVYNAAILVILHRMNGQAEAAAAAALSPGMLAMAVAADLLMVGAGLCLSLFALNQRRKRLGIELLPRARRPLTGGEKAALAALFIVLAASNAVVQIL